MTYTDICQKLKSFGIEEYRREAALLLSHFCGVSPTELPFCRDKDFFSAGLVAALKCREKRYPLQYILGEWQFCTETYSVGPGCLIPRPETEQLVLDAVKYLSPNAVFLDLCTGSGCIALSILKRRPDCRAIAVDISDEALVYANKNAKALGLENKIEFKTCDVLSLDAPVTVCGEEKVSAVLSNPPYIPDADIDGLAPELAFEPRIALDGGDDGLDFYRTIVKNFKSSLTDGGFMLFEIGAGQSEDIKKIAEENGFAASVGCDLSGHDRTVYLEK